MSFYRFPLREKGIRNQFTGGTRTEAKAANFPLLKGLSLYLVELAPGGIREPHWHVNASELGYCVKGKALITIFGPGALHDRFEITPGEVAYIPKGYMHSIENLCDEETVMAIGFNHESPEEFGLTGSLSATPKEILSSTFDVDVNKFSFLKKNSHDVVITSRGKSSVPSASRSSVFKFNFNGVEPQVENAGGTITKAYEGNFTCLQGLTMFDLHLTLGGVREPHWHPNAAELDFVVKGKARMLIQNPKGEAEIFDVQEGDVVYIPSAYYHYIENIDKGETHFAVFFNHESPEDIGMSGTIGAYSNEMLASVFSCEASYFEALPKMREDVFLGPRVITN